MIQLEIIINQRKEYNEPILYKGEIYTYFDEGLSRKVFVNNDRTKVIKLLLNSDGLNHNQIEKEIYDNSDEKELLAVTEISKDNLIIEQEFVLPIKYSDRELNIKQIIFSGKCRNEVGWNSKGDLVCFDLNEFKKY